MLLYIHIFPEHPAAVLRKAAAGYFKNTFHRASSRLLSHSGAGRVSAAPHIFAPETLNTAPGVPCVPGAFFENSLTTHHTSTPGALIGLSVPGSFKNHPCNTHTTSAGCSAAFCGASGIFSGGKA